ncbi:MAG: cation-translocating P-type ATPase [Pseudomonadota bacterium]
MSFLKTARRLARTLTSQQRRLWRSGPRLYVEWRTCPPDRLSAFAVALENAVDAIDGVRWARVVPEIARLVVEHDDAVPDERILRVVARIEREHGLARAFFPTTTRFPAEVAPLYRSAVELAADIGGLALGLGLRRVDTGRMNVWIDLSAVVTLVDNIPELRGPLVSRIGKDNADLAISLLTSFSDGMMRGWTGSVVGVVHRWHQIDGLRARRTLWQKSEQALALRWTAPRTGLLPGRQRIRPLRAGPIERYSDTAEKLSLAGFSIGLANTHDLTRSVAALFSAVPKPATLGREAFVIECEKILSRRGVLVLDRECLRRLDRIDFLVIDGALLDRRRTVVASMHVFDGRAEAGEQFAWLLANGVSARIDSGTRWEMHAPESAERLPKECRDWFSERQTGINCVRILHADGHPVAAASVHDGIDATSEISLARLVAAGIQVVIAAEDPARFRWANVEIVPRATMELHVQALQARDCGVCAVTLGGDPVLAMADISLGVLSVDGHWPQGAMLVSEQGLDAVWLLTEAIDRARRVAEQGVNLAKIDAFAGLVLSLRKLDEATIRRIKLAASAASFLSMVNGVRLARAITPMDESMHADPVPWHALDVQTTLERLGADFEGLSDAQALQRLTGPVEALPTRIQRFARTWVAEMSNPLTPVLLAGAGLSALSGAIADAALIGGVVGLNGLISGVQRFRTEERLSALDQQEARQVRVRRNGGEVALAPSVLVPGDIVHLHAGEVVPADCRIVAADNLEVDESSLTGESLPVAKNSRPSFAETVAERHSMLYAGTTVAAGQTHAVVVSRAAHSEARRAFYVHHPINQSSGVESRLEALTDLTAPIAAFAGVTVMISGLTRGQPVGEVVGAGVALTIAAVPEGLPLMATMAQLSSAGRLSGKGALVRNPRAIEALGRMNVLCADKTGTLTEGTLVLKAVAGTREPCAIDNLDGETRSVLIAALMASPDGLGGGEIAHMTDAAILAGARQHAPDTINALAGWQRIDELPFKSERGYHATLGLRDGRRRLVVKGAPEQLLPLCSRRLTPGGRGAHLDAVRRAELAAASEALARRGFRVLSVAERPMRAGVELADEHVQGLVFRGFVAFTDPVRSTARDAVEALRKAGVATKMITGDHPLTAAAIAIELALDNPASVLTGAELEQLAEEELADRVRTVSVFARVTPKQKARIVAALQKSGAVVGMTGDGANDAPAIRLADVGIALGENATAAARAAADLLVVDGRIETIVEAVVEGRSLWGSVRDAVALLVGGNLGEIGFTLIGGLLDGRSPLNARQLLLVNILTDTLPALAVALRRPPGIKPEDLLKEGPEASLGDALTRNIEWRAALTGGVTTVTWLLTRFAGNRQQAGTVAMMSLVAGQLGQTLVAGRGSREVVLSSLGALVVMGVIVQTPGLSRMFGCQPLGVRGWATVTGSFTASVGGAYALPWAERNVARWVANIQEKLADELLEEMDDDAPTLSIPTLPVPAGQASGT